MSKAKAKTAKNMKTNKKTKSAKKTKKPTELDSLSQAHGKLEETFQPTMLSQIWGDDGTSLYGTMDEQEYLARVDEMGHSDLRSHAAEIGLVPVDDRRNLTKRLLSEFRSHVANYTMPKETDAPPEKISKRVKKILEEGK